MKRILTAIILSIIVFSANAQLVVNSGVMTPTQYVQNVLVGNGIAVSNVTFSGDANQIGEFNGIATSPFIGLENGLIMATGDVNVAIGPNDTESASLPGGNFGANDPDLDVIEGSAGTNDAAILEFDFVPTGDSIKFNYVFASEEYLEYVNSINDVFGFFLSGPGITGPYTNGAANIALIPGTTTPISINTVNTGSNPSYFVDNSGNPSPTTIQFDGHTTVLTAAAQVQCGEIYHIKIAIADASDTSWDSGVFLEGGSFSSNEIAIDISVPTLDIVNGMPAVIEGCSEAVISFIRGDVTDSLTINFDISGDAINGDDYALIDDSVKFDVGVDSVAIVINPIIDGPDDFGQDTVTISYMTINACGDTMFTTGSFLILDVPNLVVDAPDVSICPTATVTLNAEAAGAVPPFVYNWVDTSNDTIQTDSIHGVSSVNVSGLASDTYYLYVTDSCNLITTIDTINVFVNDDQASISTSGDTTLYCAGQTLSVNAFPDNVGDLYGYEWFEQLGGSSIGNDSILTVAPVTSITYYVTATNICNGSTDTDTVNVIVDYTPIEITSITSDQVFECIGVDYDFNLYSEVENGTLPYSFNWYGAASSSDSLFQTSTNAPATYYLDITDACNLHALDTVEVTFEPYTPMNLITPALDSVCSGSDTELSIRVEDGVAPYSINWNNGDAGEIITINTSGVEPIMTSVTVTDKCGNQETASIEVLLKLCDVVPINVITPNGDDLNEFLFFKNLENYKDSKLTVFNRWGKSVYKDDDYKNDWKGGDLNDGTYFYVLEINDSKTTILKGTFTLLK